MSNVMRTLQKRNQTDKKELYWTTDIRFFRAQEASPW